VAEAGALARIRSVPVYLAGGIVRDLLLGRPARDVDLVVAGDALDFAERLAARLQAEVRIHGRFGTATLLLPDGRRCDVAATRAESYAEPGALPRVVPGAPIEDDLARRDFTINAMALPIGPAPRLVDPFGGRQDLAAGRIRMLHPASPSDDPTRALRAVRYGARLGFRIERQTRRWIAVAVRSGAFDAVSGDRLRRETVLLLEEDARAKAVAGLHRMGLDGAVSPALAAPGAAARIRRAEAVVRKTGAAASWLGYLLAWVAGARPDGIRRLADRLAVSGEEGRRLRSWPAVRRLLATGFRRLRPSAMGKRLRGVSDDEILAACSRLGPADRKALARWLDRGARVVLAIRGADLVAGGIRPGPEIGRALERTLAARRDGLIGRADELEFALAAARQAGR
jgi:tRNA nucleotidyltransferase (CCA-adding enzyme)